MNDNFPPSPASKLLQTYITWHDLNPPFSLISACTCWTLKWTYEGNKIYQLLLSDKTVMGDVKACCTTTSSNNDWLFSPFNLVSFWLSADSLICTHPFPMYFEMPSMPYYVSYQITIFTGYPISLTYSIISVNDIKSGSKSFKILTHPQYMYS